MTHRLTFEVANELFQPLAQAAWQTGQGLKRWETAQLCACAASSKSGAELLGPRRGVDLVRPTGADDDSTDADLARAQVSAH